MPGDFHGDKSLMGYSPGGRKESDMTERLTHIINRLVRVPVGWYKKHEV